MIEKALRYELNKISAIQNKIYPTNAPELQKAPYLVYVSSNRYTKDLNGFINYGVCHLILNILCNSYSQMKDITKQVENEIKKFPNSRIGEIKNIYVQDISIESTTETYEEQLGLQRGIIPFTIYFKEE